MSGLYYEEFEIGQQFRHAIRRTITESDNVWFSCLTHNPAALHLDQNYCENNSEFGQRIVNSALILGFMVGMSVGDTTLGTTVANLGWDKVRFMHPMFHGDTLSVESEVVDKRESRSRPDNGIIVFAQRGYNQHGTLCASCERTALMIKKSAGS